jgi:hypothetical protein
VKDVQAVARLLIVQGVAESLTAIVSLAGVPAHLARSDGADKGAAVFVVVLTLAVLSCGILKVFAGARNWNMRGRILGYVGLFSAVPTVLTFWCAPTGFAIMVYGLVVYSRPETRAAFDQAESSPPGRALGLR